MKIIIFGASGRTGHPLVSQALERGHEVTAFVRGKHKLVIPYSENLRILEGSVLTYEDVERAIEGQDAVLSVLGHTKNSPKDLLTQSSANMIRAMQAHGINRIISLTGAGVTVEQDVKQGVVSRLFGRALRWVARDLWKDSVNQKNYLAQTELDWTIVRAPRLTEGELTTEYQTGYFKFTKPMVSREDVAHFMLDELENPQYVKEYPLIGSK
ncbi:NAD(P)-dependent oxidoreductase [Halobacillus halophilus]|uniref:NAD(P)-dependent oxidoreductase n=1 Tax=Halobacillus halophilus TaxID=1570 RepID=UPI001CD3A161|nr:SDR family oxidoreductase [Halobacillus halophilus]MCA1010315.1 SDR family oxidoreductase [Halobacillus halophilus]